METSSNEETVTGTKNGFDYYLQVWVVDYIVQPCEHPESMRADGKHCCNANRYKGQDILDVREV